MCNSITKNRGVIHDLFKIGAALAAIILGAASVALADDLIGQASVIDGDTLEIHGSRIRLWGIDAPESSQLCRGDDSLQYRCGAKAANDLNAFIAGRPVNCLPNSLDRYGRTVATCSVGGADLGDWLVRNGLALDWPQYSKRKYESAQGDAEQAWRGMWAGSHVEPWLYRRCIRASGMPTSGCFEDSRRVITSDSLKMVSPSYAGAGNLTSDHPRLVMTLGVRSATDCPDGYAEAVAQRLGDLARDRGVPAADEQ
jgi:endonuclease YncB( thermonuclease family)